MSFMVVGNYIYWGVYKLNPVFSTFYIHILKLHIVILSMKLFIYIHFMVVGGKYIWWGVN